VTTLVDAPTRVDGIQLMGEMVGSGYRTPPALVRRADGQVLQLTPLLYLVLNAVDGRRSCAEIAEVVGAGMGRNVTEQNVRILVDSHLRPLGLLQRPDGSEPELKQSNPLLGLKPRIAITNPRLTRRLTAPFQVLFRPVVAAIILPCFVMVVAWVFFEHGLGASAYDAFERPHLLLLVFVVTVLSGGFHEFGHAAAARYSGAQPGTMGAGLYLVWPAFYTDVTDSYRLGRAGRIRTDLGGLYFNTIVVVLTFVWWWATGWEALLLLVATQVLQMMQQLLPLLRFDGYHVLADLAGVPDLYHRIRPTLLGLLPHRWNAPENKVLTPWARIVITLWVLITIPIMVLMLLGLIAAVPRLLGTAGAAVRTDASAVAEAWSNGGLIDISAHSLQVMGVVLPVLACAMVLSRIGIRWFKGLAQWSRDSRGKRLVAAVLSALMVTGLSWAWWPHPGNYEPIQPGERQLFTSLQEPQTAPSDALFHTGAGLLAGPKAEPVGRAGTAAGNRLSSGEPLVATFQKGAKLPTKRAPALAMVLVPTDNTETDGPSGATEDTWVFPFDKPLPPAEGDNQALAVNMTDGSVTYDLAFALVWAEDDQVLNVNEAHAYASCSDCVAVAVAFQVVLIMDNARVVVPQNLAVAANYNCYRCITAAIASQLVLSVGDMPGEEELRSLSAVWSRLIGFAREVTSYSLAAIAAQLQTFKSEIVAILGNVSAVESEASSTTTPTPTQDASSAPPPSPTSPPSPPRETAETTPTAPDSLAPTTQTAEITPTAPDSPAPTTQTASPTPAPAPSSQPSEGTVSQEASPSP